MLEFNFTNGSRNNEEYPDYFTAWDRAVKAGLNPGYVEPDDICDIIDIYLSEGKVNRAKFAIEYAFKLYPGNEELVYEVLLLLNDYELWNDLLELSEKHKDMKQVWADGHKLTALLHLGMEEDAFHFFKKLKDKYVDDKENLSIVYQAMGEALYEMDLYTASIDVVKEALAVVGRDVNLYWIQLQSYLALEDKENVEALSLIIRKMNPMDPETWNRLGGVYKEIGETGKEIEAYEFAYSLGYKDSQMLLEMVYAYEKNGNLNKALGKAEEYLALHPDSYLLNLMAANICSQKEDWAKALHFVNNALTLEPESEALYIYKSNFLLKLGEQKKAIMVLEEGIEKTKDTTGELTKRLKELQDETGDSYSY